MNVKSSCCEFKERNVWHFCMIQSTWTSVGGLNAIHFQMLISSWLLRLLCSRACMECVIKFKPQWLLASPYQDWEISEMGMLITLTKTTYMLIYLLHNLTLPKHSFFIISSTFPKLWCVFLCTLQPNPRIELTHRSLFFSAKLDLIKILFHDRTE